MECRNKIIINIENLLNVMPDIETTTQSLSNILTCKQVDDTVIEIAELIKSLVDHIW